MSNGRVWEGGKGWLQRPTDEKKFDDNWERLYGKKPDVKELIDASIDSAELSSFEVVSGKQDDVVALDTF